jgi:hypothetical protein
MQFRNTDYLFLFPLQIEASATLKRFKARRVARWKNGSCYRLEHSRYRCDVLVGGSAHRVVDAFRNWSEWSGLRTVRPSAEINIGLFGFAGALARELQQGDLCWFEEMHCLNEPVLSTEAKGFSRPRQGRLLTSTTIVAQQRERLELHARTQADAVDMEAYWIARELQTHGRKLSCCRAISDDGREDLPDWVVGLFEAKTSRQMIQRALVSMATHRQATRWLWKMNRVAKELSRRLADEIEGVVG